LPATVGVLEFGNGTLALLGEPHPAPDRRSGGTEEKLAELIPHARLLALEGMGHFPLDSSRWTVMAEAIAEHSLKA
jgi:hypothetical protein